MPAASRLSPASRRLRAKLQPEARERGGRLLRTIHLWLGVLFTLQFLLLMTTGLLVQHREFFGLENKSISRRWLPGGYRPRDPEAEIRADIVITDLHSGKIFGSYGPLLVDAAVLAWFLMLASGYGMILVSRRRNRRSADRRC